MLLVSASVNAMSISGQAGKEYTNIGVGFGTESTGLALSGNWTHNDDDGDAAGVGLGLNLPLGPLMATVGGKAFTPTRTMVMKVMQRQLAVVCSGKLVTASACLVSITTLRIRSPAELKVMKKRMLARVTPLCVQSALRLATVT